MHVPFMHREIKPTVNNGSIMHKRRAGEGIKFKYVGAYARNKPMGGGTPRSIHFREVVRIKFAPAESPAPTIRSPEIGE